MTTSLAPRKEALRAGWRALQTNPFKIEHSSTSATPPEETTGSFEGDNGIVFNSHEITKEDLTIGRRRTRTILI